MTIEQPKDRVEAAAKACDQALKQWRAAVAALGGNVSVNGHGIIHDRFAFRQKLNEAQARIAASMAALDDVPDWPSNVDYDELKE